MDPFNDVNENEINEFDKRSEITIWTEKSKRGKLNTYFSGWNESLDEIKTKIKKFKKQKGCNGTVKELDGVKIVLFQGDKVDETIEFLKQNNICSDQINVKG
jgi:translation initiation factor 1 (eIF-1/SUI1)